MFYYMMKLIKMKKIIFTILLSFVINVFAGENYYKDDFICMRKAEMYGRIMQKRNEGVPLVDIWREIDDEEPTPDITTKGEETRIKLMFKNMATRVYSIQHQDADKFTLSILNDCRNGK